MQLGSLTRALLCGTALFSMSVPLHAEQATQLDLITVTVNKIKQALSQAVGAVSVETKKDKDLYGQQTVQQIVAGMPGVTAGQSATDPATSINIRGLQDYGRVAVTIDGARQNFQRSGHNANGMFYFEPEQMQQVTVTCGPVANVYGSGAIGGVVSFDTLDALSFLKPNEQIAGSQKLSYATNGGNLLSSTTGAVRMGQYGGVLGNLVFRNNGNFTDGNGTLVGNSARDIVAGLGKVTFTPTDDVRVDLGYLIDKDHFQTPGSTVFDNQVSAQTVSGQFNWKPKDNDLIEFTSSSYWTSTNQDQNTLSSTVLPLTVGKHRIFNIDTIGEDLYNTSRFATGSLKHEFTIGADVFQDQVTTHDATGSSAGAFTPSGERTAGGAFVQDQIGLTSWLDFIVAGRYDAYSLNGGAANSSGSHFSPKGTVVFKPFENTDLKGLNFYGTYAEGYRAPSITETVINGVHPAYTHFVFDFLPNPNLRPETGHTLEAGINGKWDNVFHADDRVTFRSAVYQNKVDDYIDGVLTFGSPTPHHISYQYVNVANAKLTGIEAEIGYDSPLLFGGIAGSMVSGVNEATSEYLSNLPADKLVTSLGFHFFDQKASLGARWFLVAAQDRVPPSTPPATPLNMPGYNVVNIFANYAVNDNLNLGLNVDNLFNANYKQYADGTYQPGTSVMFTVATRLGK